MNQSDEKQYDREKKGYLWHEVDSTVERKGNFTIDGQTYYGAILKSLNNEGEAKYEFVMSLGRIYLNEEKMNERSPDMGGKITHNGKPYKLGCWAKESEKGAPFTSLGFKPLDDGTDDSYGNRYPPETEKPAF